MSNNLKIYSNITIAEKERSEIEIKGEIPSETLIPYKKSALKKLGENIEIDGFRRGHIPEKILADKIGEMAALEKAAEMALADAYPRIVADNKLKVIGRPAVTITKLALNNPVLFTIHTAVEPEIILPDYKKAASQTAKQNPDEKIEVTETEVGDAIGRLRKSARGGEKENEELPELNDEFIRKFGDFKNVEDFKLKLKENIKREKEARAREKKRVLIMDKIIEKSVLRLPDILVESELEKMLAQFKDDIAGMKLSFKDYLQKIKKTEGDLQKEWRADAEKRAKLQLVLNEIASRENITAPKDDIDRETNRLLEHFKNANPESARLYITAILTNEKVFRFLENQR